MKFLIHKIIGLFIVLTAIYIGIVYVIYDPTLTKNEFGDYVGGVLNPLLALLSTSSIIFLTYVIAKAENSKADESILTQKRITLNQMRHEALNLLDDKLNLFIHELGGLHITDEDQNNFIKRVLANQIRKERESKNEKKQRSFWLITLYEIESFAQKEYLFKELFDTDNYKKVSESLLEATSKLIKEHDSEEMISATSLNAYIEHKQNLTAVIGAFILKEF